MRVPAVLLEDEHMILTLDPDDVEDIRFTQAIGTMGERGYVPGPATLDLHIVFKDGKTPLWVQS